MTNKFDFNQAPKSYNLINLLGEDEVLTPLIKQLTQSCITGRNGTAFI